VPPESTPTRQRAAEPGDVLMRSIEQTPRAELIGQLVLSQCIGLRQLPRALRATCLGPEQAICVLLKVVVIELTLRHMIRNTSDASIGRIRKGFGAGHPLFARE